jgi:hypothetical protein
VFNFGVCFMQNGRIELVRCTDQPSLVQQPQLRFYLQPNSSFVEAGTDYFLDLSVLQPGGRLLGTDLTSSPFRVTLDPDFARFGGSGIYPNLNGHAVVSSVVRDAGEPDTGSEYVWVTLSLVPPGERSVGADVYVVGAFNGWQATPDSRLSWKPDVGRYEGEFLIKQGQYEYRYVSTRSSANRLLDQGAPGVDNSYHAMVYFRDVRLQTDRLIGVGAARSPY